VLELHLLPPATGSPVAGTGWADPLTIILSLVLILAIFAALRR
jgi:isocitrate/isopropylmalate dehydrogenase